MARGKRRRRQRPQQAPPRPSVPKCEAEGCPEFPFYGVKLPALQRRVWLCATHRRFWFLDSMRAPTKAWQKEQVDQLEARVNAWLERQTALVRLELTRDDGQLDWWKPAELELNGRRLRVPLRRHVPWRPFRWRAAESLSGVRP